MDILPVVSTIFGWIYFTSWTVSFYPQLILNWKRKSSEGLSFDFLYANMIGFGFYAIFNICMFFSQQVKEEYRKDHNGSDPVVRLTDVLFSVHAFTLTLITFVQSKYYQTSKSGESRFIHSILIIIAVLSAILVSLAVPQLITWISILYILSAFKLVTSVVKYLPQVYLNYKRKSTEGWSVENIILDFIGGTFSTAQIILDSFMSHDWTSILGHPVKFGLGMLSLIFDVVFAIQHFYLYKKRTEYEALDDVE
ncbi:Lysosomal cystine transporter domain-containing protein [Rozella allomycis CSF55]|uniref:Lysosomal cystine transporter domain-containing protein n=1 Tax=Rozella allomycis (strain CSF55) TaxID=988480 RepID=A0A075AWW0_ROZAC|nr:Lysosomal cystine transporter domain-containing protein [Rozella allomycis CSF55]|eukprot:EPZ34742.1 Lysosomal cystine transporter domain-containing protein [Rozella allomycis CSF55]